MTEWQPIETAPEMRLVLVAWPIRTRAAWTAFKCGGEWRTPYLKSAFHEGEADGPTHWMPIPTPPDAATNEKED